MATNRDYFKDLVQWDGTADYEPYFIHTKELAGFEAAEGVRLHPAFGNQLMLSYVTFGSKASAPVHQHPQEQMTMVLQGKLVFEVGHATKVMEAGDVVAIPPNVPHGAKALEEGAIAIDVFSPVREGFRELMRQQEGEQ